MDAMIYGPRKPVDPMIARVLRGLEGGIEL